MRQKALIALAAAVAIVAAAAAVMRHAVVRGHDGGDSEAEALLQRALEEGQHVAYEGMKSVIVHAPVAGTERVRVLAAGDGRSRLEYLSGDSAGVTVWDDGERLWRWHPREQRLTVTPSTRATPEQEARRRHMLQENFRPVRRGEERVAGRRATVLELRPQARGVPWRRLWVDVETGVVLASVDFDGSGAERRRTRFEEFALVPPPALDDARFQPDPARRSHAVALPPADLAGPLSREELFRRIGFTLVGPNYLPPGFAWDGGYLFRCNCPGCHRTSARLEFSDGLNTLLLLACGHACAGEVSCLEHAASAPELRRQIDGVTCLVAGELARDEMIRVLASIAAVERPR